jgi:hypothetical protein
LDSESEDELRPMTVTETTHSGLTPPGGWKRDTFCTGSRKGGSAGVLCVHREEEEDNLRMSEVQCGFVCVVLCCVVPCC